MSWMNWRAPRRELLVSVKLHPVYSFQHRIPYCSKVSPVGACCDGGLVAYLICVSVVMVNRAAGTLGERR